MIYSSSKISATVIKVSIVLLISVAVSCSDESIDPISGTLTIDGNSFAVINGSATATTLGAELILTADDMIITLWLPAFVNGNYSILNTFADWRTTATAKVKKSNGISYSTQGEVTLNKGQSSLSGSFTFKARSPFGNTETEVTGNWSNARVATGEPNTCLISKYSLDGAVSIDFEYNKDGQLIHATGYDTGQYVYDKYITYAGEKPIQILTLDKSVVFYRDSIVYQDDKVYQVYKQEYQDNLYIYTFGYNLDGKVNSINGKQFFNGDQVDEWTKTITYDEGGNQERSDAIVQFDDQNNPIQLLQKSLGNYSALSWLMPSGWMIGLWNVNGPNNVSSINIDGEESTFSFQYGAHGYPYQIETDDYTIRITYSHCGI